jgi:acyl-CoA reductase-like NAD-dependent aldehyde dehydrogenase
MEIIQEEVFGPVLCLEDYEDIEEVFSQMNASEYSFQAALFTKNIDVAHEAARKIETKALIVNDSTAFRVDWMPFGGTKSSGLGTGGTRDSLLDMTEERLVVIRVAGL